MSKDPIHTRACEVIGFQEDGMTEAWRCVPDCPVNGQVMTKDQAATLTLRITDLIKAMIFDAKRENLYSARAVGEAADALEAALVALTTEKNDADRDL